ncbi:MAG: CheB methylesterase domain-containing protein, partial [Methanospirillum sp.]|uniref:CheB methylesterase domain-containing protein n=1 Tax=Methanospirillum sp. TaxID=45200 RepID=UPI002371AE35
MKFIIIGSSTGGPRILFDIFEDLPRLSATIILIQHMPVSTATRLAKRLSQLTQNSVFIAEEQQQIVAGTVFIAPGDQHLILENYEKIRLSSEEKVNFVRPSVDVTMLALKKDIRHQILGIILSGMGNDGAEGLAHIKNIGGITAVQDPSSCTIRSMPEAALKTE